MEDIYNSPFIYGPGPYYIPDHNPNYIQAPEYIHPDSIAGQLGLTLEELAPIEQEHREFLCKFAQPPTQPTTYHNHYTLTEPLPPPPDFALPTLPQSTPTYLAQLRYTQAKLDKMDRECICEQRVLIAKYKAKQMAQKDRERKGRQHEGGGEKEVRGEEGANRGDERSMRDWARRTPG